MEELEKRLRDVWLGDVKIRVNRARFGREDKEEGKRDKQIDKVVTGRVGGGFRQAERMAGTSY